MRLLIKSVVALRHISVQTSVEKTIQVWEGVGNTFSSLVSSSSPKPYAGPCLSEAANEALSEAPFLTFIHFQHAKSSHSNLISVFAVNLDNLYKLGCQLNPDGTCLCFIRTRANVFSVVVKINTNHLYAYGVIMDRAV